MSGLKLRRSFNTSQFGTTGFPLDLGTSQSLGVICDNFSNQWIQIGSDLWVPPFTRGWADDFYGSSASSTQVKTGAPPGQVQPVSVINGQVTVAIYDDFITPNAGTSVFSDLNPFQYAVDGTDIFFNNLVQHGAAIPMGYQLPMFYAAAAENEGDDYIAQRQLTWVFAGSTACAAGVTTNLLTPFANNLKRLAFMTISLSVTTDVIIDNTAFPVDASNTGLYAGFLSAGIPAIIQYPGNGMKFDSVQLGPTTFRAKCTLAATVFWTFGLSLF